MKIISFISPSSLTLSLFLLLTLKTPTWAQEDSLPSWETRKQIVQQAPAPLEKTSTNDSEEPITLIYGQSTPEPVPATPLPPLKQKPELPLATSKPPPPAFLYQVKKGDTLWSIGKKYDITVQELQQANHLHNHLIHIGQTLRIPPN